MTKLQNLNLYLVPESNLYMVKRTVYVLITPKRYENCMQILCYWFINPIYVCGVKQPPNINTI